MATLGSKAVGSIVKLNESGSPVLFYVAKHDYESGLNGAGRTLLVRKDCYDQRAYDEDNVNAYSGSDIDIWLNGTYFQLLDPDIRTAIGTTKFYYTIGNGNSNVSTLQRAVFLMSIAELGKSGSNANAEGSVLPIADTLQYGSRQDKGSMQWTRTPQKYRTDYAYYLQIGGGLANFECFYDRGSRPVFTLPADLFVSSDGTITTEPPDPLSPKDGHNTRISGAACQFEGGTVKLGGVKYELASGTVVIGGTAYEIPLDGGKCKVTITGYGNATNCYVTIGGVKYTDETTVNVAPGTKIRCAVKCMNGYNSYVYLNGVMVVEAMVDNQIQTYEYTANSDVNIQVSYMPGGGSSIRITEE